MQLEAISGLNRALIAQQWEDAVVSKNTNELKTRTPPMSSLVRGDAVRRLMETKSERGSSGLAYSVTCLTALRRGHAAPPNRREVDDGRR